MTKVVNFKFERLAANTGDMALKRRAKNIILGLDLQDGDKVLDIGCGDGYYSHLLSNLGIRLILTGTDFSRVDLARARKNLKGKKVKLAYGDLMKKLPFRSNSFDKIVLSEVTEHLPDDLKGLREVRRVLKNGGTLCLTVPNHNYPFLWDPVNWVLERTIGKPIRQGFFAGLWNQHERLYTKKSIIKVLKKAGFEINTAKSLTYWCLPFNHYIINLVARGLAAGAFSNDLNKSLSKYTKKPKRPMYLDIAFSLVNTLDKLNDIWQPDNSGVAVFVKAYKK